MKKYFMWSFIGIKFLNCVLLVRFWLGAPKYTYSPKISVEDIILENSISFSE